MMKLPRNRIVKKNKEIQAIYRGGKSYVTRYFICYLFRTNDMPIRVAVAAGKKLGNAVIRNSVKRRLREIFRQNQSQLTGSGQVLIVGRKPMLDADYRDIEKAFLSVCRKIKREQERG